MKRWIIIASLVVVFAALLYALLAWQTAKAPEAEHPQTKTYSVSFSDEYGDGTHEISGTVLAETPCQSVTAAAAHIESGGIRLDLTLTSPEGVCLERETALSFEVSVEAPEDAAIAAFVNGAAALHD